jgi:hypothetical protein
MLLPVDQWFIAHSTYSPEETRWSIASPGTMQRKWIYFRSTQTCKILHPLVPWSIDTNSATWSNHRNVYFFLSVSLPVDEIPRTHHFRPYPRNHFRQIKCEITSGRADKGRVGPVPHPDGPVCAKLEIPHPLQQGKLHRGPAIHPAIKKYLYLIRMIV